MDSIDQHWLRDLPKIELHLHLEGSMSVDTVAELSERHGVDPSPIRPEGLPERFSFERDIMLEVCPTSNDLLQVVESVGVEP